METIKQMNCTDSYIADMARYSIAINRKRAIPDRKDGLKPAQRKIVYAVFNDFHAISENTKVKSAQIDGRVTGEYSPHGCMKGNTLIYGLSGKVYTIENLYHNNETVPVIAVDPYTMKTMAVLASHFRIGQYTNDIYHIVLSNGSEIQCTGNHPIMISDGTFINAENLNIGDDLYCANSSPDKTDKFYIVSHAKQDTIKITNIYIEKVLEPTPMYDFTILEGPKNMLIPTTIGEHQITFVCIHNSAYQVMINIAQPFGCKMPLISSKSNIGSVMGDGAAASRYTEAWLSPFALDNVIGALTVSKEVVDMVPTYTGTRLEPEYLPVKVPLLLVNGAYGIGLGMMVEIPKHNLSEVIDVTLRLLDNPNADAVLIPDHCTPCNIIDTNWKSICNKGNGKYKVRSTIEIEESKNGTKSLHIRSVPDRVSTKDIKEDINKLIVENKLPQIVSVDDASKNEVDLIVELKKGSDAQFVKEALYKYTNCEKTYTVNFEVIDGIDPIRMSYKSYLLSFIDFAMANKFREYCSRMRDVNTRFHQVDAYIKVLRSGEIDKIIAMIKKQTKVDDNYLVEYLIKKIGLTDLQATFIINSNIKRLSLGYLKKYEEEAKGLLVAKKDYTQKIIDDSFIKDEVRKDLIEAKQKYGTPRTCKVIKVSDDSNIPKGVFKLIVTENNYVRKIGENDLVTTVRGDAPNFVIKVDNTQNILLFDNKGKVFKLPVHKIPVMERSDQGIDIRTIIRGLTARIIAVVYEFGLKELSRLKTKYYLSVITKGNCIKKLDIEDFLSVPPSGIIYARLNEGDVVTNVEIITDHMDVILYSKHKALRISGKDIPNYKRNTLGVSAMNLKSGEEIVGMSVVYPKSSDIVVITKTGKVNKFNISGLATDKRNRSGVKVMKLAKEDQIHSIYSVIDSDIIHIVTSGGMTDLPVSSIQSSASISPGTKMISTKSDTILKTEIIHN